MEFGQAVSSASVQERTPPHADPMEIQSLATGSTDRLRALGRKLQAGRNSGGDRHPIATESGGPSGYDAGKKAEGRKRHLVVDAEGLPLGLAVHAASVQDRDGAPAVILGVLEKALKKMRTAEPGREAGVRAQEAEPILRSSEPVLYRRTFAWIQLRIGAWRARGMNAPDSAIKWDSSAIL